MKMENNQKIESLMQEAMSKIKELVDTNTVVGSPIVCNDHLVVIPITKVTIGFVAGGGEYTQNIPPKNAQKEYPFAGGSSAGISVTPIGFLVSKNGDCKFLTTENRSNFDEILKIVANVTSKLSDKSDKKE